MLSLYAIKNNLRYRGKDAEKLKLQRQVLENINSDQALLNANNNTTEKKDQREIKSILDNPAYHNPPAGVKVSDKAEPLFYKAELSFLQDMLNQSSLLPKNFANFIMKHLGMSPLQYLLLVILINPNFVQASANVTGTIENVNQTLSTIGLDAKSVLSSVGPNITINELIQKITVKFMNGFPAFAADLCKNAAANHCNQFYGIVNSTSTYPNISSLSNSTLPFNSSLATNSSLFNSSSIRFLQGVLKNDSSVQSWGTGSASVLGSVLNQIKAWLSFDTIDNIKLTLNTLIKDLNLTQTGKNEDHCLAFNYQHSFSGSVSQRTCVTKTEGNAKTRHKVTHCTNKVTGGYTQTFSTATEFFGVDPSVCQKFKNDYTTKFYSTFPQLKPPPPSVPDPILPIIPTTPSTPSLPISTSNDSGLSLGAKLGLGLGIPLGIATIVGGSCYIFECGYWSREAQRARRQARDRAAQAQQQKINEQLQIREFRRLEAERQAWIRHVFVNLAEQFLIGELDSNRAVDAAFVKLFRTIAEYADFEMLDNLEHNKDYTKLIAAQSKKRSSKPKEICINISTMNPQSISQQVLSNDLVTRANNLVQDVTVSTCQKPSDQNNNSDFEVAVIPGYVITNIKKDNIELSQIAVNRLESRG